MIIWSGWGILVLVFGIVGLVVGIPVGTVIAADENTAMAISVICAGLAMGLGSFLFARQMEKGTGRVYIDEQTGQRIVVGRSAGSLFFVPVRYWAYVGPVLAIAFAALLLMNPVSSTADPAVVETSTSSANPV
jgi:hypothetical protein